MSEPLDSRHFAHRSGPEHPSDERTPRIAGLRSSLGPPDEPVARLVHPRTIRWSHWINVPLLFVMGVLTLDWEGGRPRLSINRQKAAEVRQELSHDAQALRNQRHGLSR